jgi:hypothetical protein
MYQKKWSDHLELMDRKFLQKLAFQYQPFGTAGYGKTKTKMEGPRTPLALKEQVLRLNLDYDDEEERKLSASCTSKLFVDLGLSR